MSLDILLFTNLSFYGKINTVNSMTHILRRIKRSNFLARFISLLLGSFILTFVYNKFLVTNHIVVGGVSGLAILIEETCKISTTLFINLSNIFLVILSFMVLGKRKTIDQLIGCIVYIIMLNITAPLATMWNFSFESPMLMLTLVSIIYGAANGIIYRAGYSTGGTDFLSQIISEKIHQPITKISLVIQVSIILLSTFVFGMPTVMMSVFIIYFSNIVTNTVLFGVSSSKMVYVMSKKNDEIEDYIMNKIKVGATEIKVRGGYLGKRRQLLLCVVHNAQYSKFKNVILRMDPDAFIITNACYEVDGGTKYSILPF